MKFLVCDIDWDEDDEMSWDVAPLNSDPWEIAPLFPIRWEALPLKVPLDPSLDATRWFAVPLIAASFGDVLLDVVPWDMLPDVA